jgi:hypothetical protein
MQRVLVIFSLLLPFATPHTGQTPASKQRGDEVTIARSILVSEIQALDSQSSKIESPLARALAKAETASATWLFDKSWAKRLLREAYTLTLNKESEQTGLTRGTATPPPGEDRARAEVRDRIMAIARRDKDFAEELVQLGAKQTSSAEEHAKGFADLAAKSLQSGDKASAGNYILQSVSADPAQLTAPFQILALAAQDRAAADKLILQYIERLRASPPLDATQNLARTALLSTLVFPAPVPNQDAPRPDPDVMRAYVGYLVENLVRMEESEPGSIRQARSVLLNSWVPLQRYAPELIGTFLDLERVSRSPGESLSLPNEEMAATAKDNYEKRVKDILAGGEPDDFTIISAIGRGDFENARKMIERVDAGPRKTQLSEIINTKEAVSLAERGDMIGAEGLAKQLKNATSMRKAYPALIKRCAAQKDQACADRLVYQAIKQLKEADTATPLLPVDVSASNSLAAEEFDPVMSCLNNIAEAVASINSATALEVLDELSLAANRSRLDTARGYTGIDTELFRTLAARDESRTRQVATSLKDPLRQIVALAAIYQSKAQELDGAMKRGRQPPVL